MDFSLSEAQTELAGLVRKILAERDSPWGDLAAAGVLAAGLPEALGGSGVGFLEQCSVLCEIGRAVSPVPYLASVVLGAGAIASFGSAEQQRRWAAPAGDGSVVLTVALSEEDGDDPSSPSVVAARAGGRWPRSGRTRSSRSGRLRRGGARWCSPRRWPRKTGTTRACPRRGPNGRTGSGC